MDSPVDNLLECNGAASPYVFVPVVVHNAGAIVPLSPLLGSTIVRPVVLQREDEPDPIRGSFGDDIIQTLHQAIAFMEPMPCCKRQAAVPFRDWALAHAGTGLRSLDECSTSWPAVKPSMASY